MLGLLATTLGCSVPAAPLRSATRASWELMPEFSATVATGVSFYTPTEGMIIGGQDGVGAQIWRTEDGGRENIPAAIESGELPPLLILHGAKLRESAVASGIFAAWSSQDGGRSFRAAEGPGAIGPAQSVDAFLQNGNLKFAIVGDTIGFNGVSVSDDSGATFGAGVEVFEDRSIEGNIWARYGAFPDESAWFVSGGRWPTSSQQQNDDSVHFLSQSVFVKKAPAANESKFGFVLPSQHRRAQDANPFTAGIAKSTDMGQTWETVFETETAGYYFNQISCFTAERCVVVAEGGGQARIFTSSDGGREWRQTLLATGSIMAVEAISPTGEGWAAGGVLGLQFTGLYWHTADFGESWQVQEVPGVYAFDLSFPPGFVDVGYSVALTPAASRLVRYN